MIKKSIVFTLIGVSAWADPAPICRQFYDADAGVKAEFKKTSDREVKAKNIISKEQRKRNEEIYFPMFEDAFKTEFSESSLDPQFKELFRKLLFEPTSLSDVDWARLRNGVDHKVARGSENVDGSGLKYYFNFNHQTIEKQERQAEAILSKMRGKTVELDQLEKVALRMTRVIGRDYHYFEGTPLQFDKQEIERMKNRFLKLFEVGNVRLTDQEIKELHKFKVLEDDIMSDSRYDLAQDYNPKHVTNEMIEKQNNILVATSEKWKNPVEMQREELLKRDPALRASLRALNEKLVESKELRDSLKFVRLAVANLIGKEQPFKDSKEFGTWLETQNEFLKQGLERLREPGVAAKLARLTEGLTDKSLYQEHMNVLARKMDFTKEDDVKMMEFYQSPLGERLFVIARNELKTLKGGLFGIKPKVTPKVMVDALEKNVRLLDDVLEIKRANPVILDAIYNFKLKRTGLTEFEANEIFNILTYDSSLRPLNLVKFDPNSRFGFCFGRAYFANLILQKHGVHRDSIKKIFIYGPMKGGFFGWNFHVATIVSREDGGFWVMDPSHGKPEKLEDWLNHYRDHKKNGKVVQGASKNDRLKAHITDGDRFGRNHWGTPDWDTNLKINYPSVWNKMIGSDINYFRDNMEHLEKVDFDKEKKGAFKALFDNILDAANLGY